MLVLTADKLGALPQKDLSRAELIQLYYELMRNPADFEMIMVRAGNWRNDLSVKMARSLLNAQIQLHPDSEFMHQVVRRILQRGIYRI